MWTMGDQSRIERPQPMSVGKCVRIVRAFRINAIRFWARVSQAICFHRNGALTAIERQVWRNCSIYYALGAQVDRPWWGAWMCLHRFSFSLLNIRSELVLLFLGYICDVLGVIGRTSTCSFIILCSLQATQKFCLRKFRL